MTQGGGPRTDFEGRTLALLIEPGWWEPGMAVLRDPDEPAAFLRAQFSTGDLQLLIAALLADGEP